MANSDRPYGGSSKQRLTDLINAANGTSLIEGIDFEYGTLEELKTHAKHNTRVQLLAKKPGVANARISYTRLGIDILAHLPPEMIGEIFVDSFPFSVRQSIEKINQALGLNLTADEVENYVFKESRDSYPIRIKKGASLAWLPSEIKIKGITIDPNSDNVLLTLVWPKFSLNGLYPPNRRR